MGADFSSGMCSYGSFLTSADPRWLIRTVSVLVVNHQETFKWGNYIMLICVSFLWCSQHSNWKLIWNSSCPVVSHCRPFWAGGFFNAIVINQDPQDKKVILKLNIIIKLNNKSFALRRAPNFFFHLERNRKLSLAFLYAKVKFYICSNKSMFLLSYLTSVPLYLLSRAVFSPRSR